jgi:hypothetical protein
MRFTKVGLALMAVLVTSASVTWAMDARKQVLDLGQAITGENTPASLVLDSSDAFTNPAYLTSYANLLGMDSGPVPTLAGNDLYSGFAFSDLSVVGVPGVLGIQIGRNFGLMKTATLNATDSLNDLDTYIGSLIPTGFPPFGIPIDSNIDGNPTLTDLGDVQPYGIMYGLNLMQDLQVGAAVNFVGNSIKGKLNPADPTSPDMSKSISDLEVRLGGVMAIMPELSCALDLGANFPNYSFSYDDTATPIKQKIDFNAFNFDVNARLAWALSQQFEAVLVAGYASNGGDTDIDPDTANPNDDVTLTLGSNDVSVGVGGLIKDDTGLIGILLGFMTQDYTNKIKTTFGTVKDNPSYIYFPSLKLLAEKKLAQWFTLRGALAYTYQGSSTDYSDPTISYTQHAKATSYLTTAIGATVSIDPFYIESVLSKNLLFNGPWLLGGVINTGLNTVVSLGYRF